MNAKARWEQSTVDELARRTMVTVGPAETVRRTLTQMIEQHSGCVLVVEGPHLLGILTERDVLTRVFSKPGALDEPVRNYMTSNPRTAVATSRVCDVARDMLREGYRHLPIVDEREMPIGVVSIKSIVQYLVEYIPNTVYTAPEEGTKFPQAPDGA